MIYKNLELYGKLVDIEIENERIKTVGKVDKSGLDCTGLSVYPGLIDIHLHGCGGYDTMDEGALPHLAKLEAKNGTTSFLPTTMTASLEDIKKVTDVSLDNIDGARILGFHLEGPYISVKYKGAQNEKYIRNPDISEFNSIKNIKMVTIAPELDGAMEFIENCSAVVSLGHTDTDYDRVICAIEKGANCLTHTFNAMPPLHHRNPGLIGAAAEKNIYAQAICDGRHIHKAAILALYKMFGRDKMVLISDSMRAAGLQDGKYDLGGQEVTVCGGAATLSDGTIAGSTSFLWECVKKAVEFGIPKEDAVIMATKTPATLMEFKEVGEVKEGYAADLIFADENMNIKTVLIGGEEVK